MFLDSSHGADDDRLRIICGGAVPRFGVTATEEH